MMKLIDLLKEANDLIEKYSFVPYGNSSVQNLFLLVQDEFSSGRKLRAYLLRLVDRVRAVNENIFRLRKELVKLKRLQRQLEQEKDELKREEIQIDIERILNNISYVKKLYFDAFIEINDLVFAIKTLENKPETREEFEMQELEHFAKRLGSYLLEPDPVRGLKALGCSLVNNGDSVEVHMDDETRKRLLLMLEKVSQTIEFNYSALSLTEEISSKEGESYVDSVDK